MKIGSSSRTAGLLPALVRRLKKVVLMEFGVAFEPGFTERFRLILLDLVLTDFISFLAVCRP